MANLSWATMLDSPGSWPARGFEASGAADDKVLQVRGSRWQPTRSPDGHTEILGEAPACSTSFLKQDN
jgi:hypothetical protein